MPESSHNVLIFKNARIWKHPEASSIVVRDGAIDSLAQGTPSIAGAEVIDLHGATVLPGLVDAHGHVYGLGQSLDTVALNGSSDADEMVRRIAAAAGTLPRGEWVLGRGWDQNDWPVKEFPTAAMVDARVADRPVWVRRIDGHAGLANSAAMRAARIDATTPDPAGGKIVRDAEGNPTGVLIDHAMTLVEDVVPEPSHDKRKRELIAALDVIAANGLTGVHDAGSDDVTIDLLRELAAEGKLPVRLYVMIADEPTQIARWFAKGPLIREHDRLTVRSVKMYADGALGSRGAALLAPYSDDASNTGLLLTSAEHITDVSRRARASGFQVNTHAIGDRGTRMVLDGYEAAGVTAADRFRIEHLQVAAPSDFPRLAAHGVIASMQPTHATSDMDWAELRLGSERIRGAYAWRTVLQSGARLAFGSDFPIESVNPFFGLYSATTRQDHDGKPAGGWYPEQRLTLDEAIDAFTTGAAYASFEEERLGTIAPGKLADFTIVENLAQPIWKAKVLYTVVGGKVVYRSK